MLRVPFQCYQGANRILKGGRCEVPSRQLMNSRNLAFGMLGENGPTPPPPPETSGSLLVGEGISKSRAPELCPFKRTRAPCEDIFAQADLNSAGGLSGGRQRWSGKRLARFLQEGVLGF